jgi:hypothetical protein
MQGLSPAGTGFTVIPSVYNEFAESESEAEEKIIEQEKVSGFELTIEEKQVNQAEMNSIVKAMDITWSKEKRKLTGTKDLSDSSLVAYAKHYRGLLYFLTKIKDYKSMLILQENAPDFLCPSVNAKSLALYYRWKLLPEGTPVEGLPFLSSGTWKDPKNMIQFRAALVALHKSRGHSGVYQEPCESCLQKYEGLLGSAQFEFKGGCRQHPSNPILWLTGNPMANNVVEDCAKSMFRLHSAYKVKGDSPLTPSELLKLRGRLLSSNLISDFEIWVMVIVACRMFLREDEVSSLKCEDIVPDVTCVKASGYVEGIAFQVQGKCDKNPVILMMWSDPNFPALCPVNALLAWINLSKIKSGFIFPSISYLNQVLLDKNWNGCVEDKNDVMHYSTFLDRFKKLCKQLILDQTEEELLDKDRKFGTHSCRKTGYLLGSWGGAPDPELMDAARHKTIKNAMKYKCDALFLLELAKSSTKHDGFNVLMGTPVWRPQYCKNFQLARSVNGNRGNYTSLHKVSLKFKELASSKLRRTINTPLDFAEVTSLSLNEIEDAQKGLENILKKYPAEDAQQILNFFSKLVGDLQAQSFVSQTITVSRNAHDVIVADPSSSEVSFQATHQAALDIDIASTTDSPSLKEKPKKRKRGGTIELRQLSFRTKISQS